MTSIFCGLFNHLKPYLANTAWAPHIHSRMLEESRGGNQSSSNINCLGIGQSEVESVSVQSYPCRETSQVMMSQDISPILNDLEQGRRF